jgi:hypothetical protein
MPSSKCLENPFIHIAAAYTKHSKLFGQLAFNIKIVQSRDKFAPGKIATATKDDDVSANGFFVIMFNKILFNSS